MSRDKTLRPNFGEDATWTGATQALNSQDLEVTIHTAHSGNVGFKQILKQVLLCGDYNDVLEEVNNIRREGREAEYNYTQLEFTG